MSNEKAIELLEKCLTDKDFNWEHDRTHCDCPACLINQVLSLLKAEQHPPVLVADEFSKQAAKEELGIDVTVIKAEHCQPSDEFLKKCRQAIAGARHNIKEHCVGWDDTFGEIDNLLTGFEQALACLQQQAQRIKELTGIMDGQYARGFRDCAAKLQPRIERLEKLIWDCHYLINTNKSREASELIIKTLNPEAIKRRKAVNEMKSELAKARDKWFESEDGKKCSEGQASGQYLRNRLEMAFLAGYNFADEQFDKQIEETIDMLGKKNASNQKT